MPVEGTRRRGAPRSRGCTGSTFLASAVARAAPLGSAHDRVHRGADLNPLPAEDALEGLEEERLVIDEQGADGAAT